MRGQSAGLKPSATKITTQQPLQKEHQLCALLMPQSMQGQFPWKHHPVVPQPALPGHPQSALYDTLARAQPYWLGQVQDTRCTQHGMDALCNT